MTAITLLTNNMQFVDLFETLAKTLNVSFEKVEKDTFLSKSMEQALEEENTGQVTKLVNYKNAVAEMLA
jgi:hypothetical protein